MRRYSFIDYYTYNKPCLCFIIVQSNQIVLQYMFAESKLYPTNKVIIKEKYLDYLRLVIFNSKKKIKSLTAELNIKIEETMVEYKHYLEGKEDFLLSITGYDLINNFLYQKDIRNIIFIKETLQRLKGKIHELRKNKIKMNLVLFKECKQRGEL